MKKYAFIVGIDGDRLKYAANDAEAFATVLEAYDFDTLGGAFVNAQATGNRIVRSLAKLKKKITPHDLFLFAFFGHGASENGTAQYVVPAGADSGFRTSWVRIDTLVSDVRRLRMRDLVVVLDVCRDESGDLAAGLSSGDFVGLRARDVEKVPRDEPNTFIIFSCAEGEKAWESDQYGHSLFAKHLIDGIRNRAGDPKHGISGWRDGKLCCDVLAAEVQAKVTRVANDLGLSQQPEFMHAPRPIVLAGANDNEAGDVDEERPQNWDGRPPSIRRAADAADRRPLLSMSRVVAGLAAVCVAGLFIVGGGSLSPPPQPEPPCPAGPPSGMNLLLLHAHAPLSESLRSKLTAPLENTALSTVEYGLLELRLADGTSPGGRILFSRCRPKSAIAGGGGGPDAAYSRWLTEFKGAVRDGVAKVGASSAPSLMMTIKQLVEQRSWAGQAYRANLTIASSLVEHTDAYSHRNGEPSFDQFTSTAAYDNSRTDLLGAKVQLYYLRDDTNAHLAAGKHATFWAQWLVDAGADRRQLTVEKMEAAQK